MNIFVAEKYGRMIIKICLSMKIHNIKIKWTGNRELGEKRYTILTLIHLFKIMDDGSYQVADI